MSTPGCSCADESRPNPASSSNPKLPSFLSQVLYSLQVLLNQSTHRCGISLKALTRYMRCNFKLSGDVTSQVETALLQATQNGLVHEDNCRYLPLGAFAKIQRCRNQCKRKALAEDTLSVFMHKSNVKSPCRRKRKRKKCKGNLLERSNTSILNLLTQLECVLKERTKKPCDKLYASNLEMVNMRAQEKPCCPKAKRKKKKRCDAHSSSSEESNCPGKCTRKKRRCKRVKF